MAMPSSLRPDTDIDAAGGTAGADGARLTRRTLLGSDPAWSPPPGSASLGLSQTLDRLQGWLDARRAA